MDHFVGYQVRDSDIPYTWETTREIHRGEANVPNISHATTAFFGPQEEYFGHSANWKQGWVESSYPGL